MGQCWIWSEDLLALYISITFFVSRNLRLGIRVFATQSYWKFTLRWINTILISFIGWSIPSPALCLAPVQLMPDQWWTGCLIHVLARRFSLASSFSVLPIKQLARKWINYWECGHFSTSLSHSLESLRAKEFGSLEAHDIIECCCGCLVWVWVCWCYYSVVLIMCYYYSCEICVWFANTQDF